jgi:hypothetical protein
MKKKKTELKKNKQAWVNLVNLGLNSQTCNLFNSWLKLNSGSQQLKKLNVRGWNQLI